MVDDGVRASSGCRHQLTYDLARNITAQALEKELLLNIGLLLVSEINLATKSDRACALVMGADKQRRRSILRGENTRKRESSPEPVARGVIPVGGSDNVQKGQKKVKCSQPGIQSDELRCCATVAAPRIPRITFMRCAVTRR